MKFYITKKTALLAAALIIIIAAGGLTYTYLVKKSPKYIYLQAEAKNYQRLADYWTEKYGAGWELYKLVQGNPSRISTEISGNFQFAGIIGGFINQQLAGVQRGLEQTKLSLVLEQDPEQEQYLVKSTLHMAEADLLALELFQTQEMTAVRIPTIFEKYLFLGNNQFISTIERIAPNYQGSDEVPRLNRLKHSGQLVQQLQDSLLPKYGLYIWSGLTDEMFTLEKTTYPTAQGEQKAQRITLQMKAGEIEAFSQGLLVQLEQDKDLMELLRELRLEENANKLFDELSALRFPEGLTMQVIIDEQGNILSRQVDVGVSLGQIFQSVLTSQSELTADQHGSEASEKGVQIKYTSQRTLLSVTQDGRVQRERASWQVELEPRTYVKQAKLEEIQGRPSLGAGAEQVSPVGNQRKLQLEVDTLRQHDTQTEEKSIVSNFSLSFGRALPLEGASWLTRLAGEIEIPRIRGQLKQDINEPLTNAQVHNANTDTPESASTSDNQEINNQVDLSVNIDFTSRLLGKQSLGVQLALKNKVQFTETLLFPMIEKENAIHFAQLSDTEWWQIISHLEETLVEWWKRVGRS